MATEKAECIWGFHDFDDRDVCIKCALSYQFLASGGREAAQERIAARALLTGPTAAEVREAYEKAAPKGYIYRVMNPEPKPEPKRADPYNPMHMTPEKLLHNEERIVAAMTGATNHGAKNEAARLRNIAALKSELGREVTPPRFPHPGRNFALEKWR